jgi:hypothetical protein
MRPSSQSVRAAAPNRMAATRAWIDSAEMRKPTTSGTRQIRPSVR